MLSGTRLVRYASVDQRPGAAIMHGRGTDAGSGSGYADRPLDRTPLTWHYRLLAGLAYRRAPAAAGSNASQSGPAAYRWALIALSVALRGATVVLPGL